MSVLRRKQTIDFEWASAREADWEASQAKMRRAVTVAARRSSAPSLRAKVCIRRWLTSIQLAALAAAFGRALQIAQLERQLAGQQNRIAHAVRVLEYVLWPHFEKWMKKRFRQAVVKLHKLAFSWIINRRIRRKVAALPRAISLLRTVRMMQELKFVVKAFCHRVRIVQRQCLSFIWRNKIQLSKLSRTFSEMQEEHISALADAVFERDCSQQSMERTSSLPNVGISKRGRGSGIPLRSRLKSIADPLSMSSGSLTEAGKRIIRQSKEMMTKELRLKIPRVSSADDIVELMRPLLRERRKTKRRQIEEYVERKNEFAESLERSWCEMSAAIVVLAGVGLGSLPEQKDNFIRKRWREFGATWKYPTVNVAQLSQEEFLSLYESGTKAKKSAPPPPMA